MDEQKKCPDCGAKMVAGNEHLHRPGGICLEKLNRNVKGSPCNRVVSGSELATRTTNWPENPERQLRDHRAHINRLNGSNED